MTSKFYLEDGTSYEFKSNVWMEEMDRLTKGNMYDFREHIGERKWSPSTSRRIIRASITKNRFEISG